MTVNAGDIPVADDFNQVRVVVKAAGQVVNNSTTYVNDAELLASVDASTVYAFRLPIFFTSPSAADINFRLTFPTGATCAWGAIRLNVTTANAIDVASFSSATSGSSALGAGGTASVQLCLIEGSLTVGSTAGTLQLQWAQGTQTPSDTTVHAGSSLQIFQQ